MRVKKSILLVPCENWNKPSQALLFLPIVKVELSLILFIVKKENNKLTSYYELITFYNKLDKQQKEEFRHYLEKVRREKIVPSQVENYLQGLSQDNYVELIVQAKLLLIS